MQQRAAAETKDVLEASPLPAAAGGVHLPGVSGGQAFNDGTAFQAGQQSPFAGAQPGMPQPWAPLQQAPLWQQDKETMDSLAAQRAALHMPTTAQQQQQQQQQQVVAGLGEEPSIFADMPVDELPVAMHLDCQVTRCKQQACVAPPIMPAHPAQQAPSRGVRCAAHGCSYDL